MKRIREIDTLEI